MVFHQYDCYRETNWRYRVSIFSGRDIILLIVPYSAIAKVVYKLLQQSFSLSVHAHFSYYAQILAIMSS